MPVFKTVQPGTLNAITDVPGIQIGHAVDISVRTGVTVLLPLSDGFRVVAERRGGAPGTREIEALAPGTLVEHVHGLVLSGGSVFGLEAAGAVQNWLAKRHIGYHIGDAVAPVIPAAILFDLNNGGDKRWGDTPPYGRLGIEACETLLSHTTSSNAGKSKTEIKNGTRTKTDTDVKTHTNFPVNPSFPLGNVGAGYGAVAGPYKGGLGSASVIDPVSGYTIGGLVVVNSFGSPATPDGTTLWAAPFELASELGELPLPARKTQGLSVTKQKSTPGANTTLGIIATDAPLNKDGLRRLAAMAVDGFPRALHPVHTPFDGDILFAVSTSSETTIAVSNDPGLLTSLGTLAADTIARSIGRAIIEAEPLGEVSAFAKG